MKLRPYQKEGIAAVERDWALGTSRPALLMATGLGKTVILSRIAREAAEWTGAHRDAEALNLGPWNGQFSGTPMILVHRDELVKQTVAKLRDEDSTLRIGIVKGQKHNEYENVDVIVASVATLARKKRREQIPATAVNLVIVDECHHSAANSYVNVMEYFGCFRVMSNGRIGEVDFPTRALGVTATMSREDSRGLGEIWQTISLERDILFGITHTGDDVERETEDGDGYLCDVESRLIEVDGLDLTQVARSQGDFAAGSLGEALVEIGAASEVVKAYEKEANGRRAILFAPTVATAQLFAAEFVGAGWSTEVITGDTLPDERAAIYARFKAGETLIICSCMVLTEGFDAPWAEVAIICRPTSSQALYIQMVGRVLRPSPKTGKVKAMVLDMVGAVKRHKLCSIADLSKAKVRPDESLMEAVKREKTEAKPLFVQAGTVEGDVQYIETDLFHRGKGAWLETEKGVRFLRTTSHYYFVWHEVATKTYKVGVCRTHTAAGGKWLIAGLTYDQAIAQCESYAMAADPSIAGRNSAWRKKKGHSFSDGFKTMAERRGVEYDSNSNAGEVSDAIAVKNASKVLDANIKTPTSA